MGKLILVRHGQTDKNVNRSLHSVNDLEALNSEGKKQIKELVEKLKPYFPFVVYSSKEKRAVQSAKIISGMFKISFEETDGMQERNWGVFTGKPWEEVKKILDPMTLEERYNYVPPKGESWKTFEARLIKAIKKVISNNPKTNTVVITHGGAIRALTPFLLGVPKEESFKYDPNNASLTVFEIDKDNKNHELGNSY